MKKKLLILILITHIFTPLYVFASDTAYVWSEIFNPVIQTVSSINKDKRKFFKFNMW